MAFPSGAAKRTLILGRDLAPNGTIITDDFYLDTEVPVFWHDSHESILPTPKRIYTGSDGIASISLPNTSQAGWKNEAQEDVTGWHYTITRKINGKSKTIVFDLPDGVGSVYLNDLVRENPTAPVTVAYQGILTVNGIGPDGAGNVVVAGGGGGGASDLASISDMSVLAREFNAETTAANMRGKIGAGTSDLGLGTSSSTAMAGNTAVTAITGATAAFAAKADAAATTTALAGKANTSHTHAQSDVTGLVAALAALASTTTVTANDVAVRALITALTTRVTNLETAMNARMVFVPYISGVYTLLAGSGTVSPRKFTGPEDPTGNPEYDPEGRGDEWDGVSLP